jgi:hypothetical protein
MSLLSPKGVFIYTGFILNDKKQLRLYLPIEFPWGSLWLFKDNNYRFLAIAVDLKIYCDSQTLNILTDNKHSD